MFHYDVFTPNRVRGIVVPVDDIWDRNAGFILHCDTKLAGIALLYGDPILTDENRDSPERDMVNPSTDSYMWPIRGAP